MSTVDRQTRRRSFSQGEIDEVVAELRSFERAARGGGGRAGKDAQAAQALALAGALVESLAGWAIDHQVGLAATGAAYEPMDLVAAPGVDADDDRHEKAGAVYDWSSPAVNRRALANLLAANPGGLPYELALEAALGLEALELGETPPIFERRTGRSLDDLSYTLALLRLRAVEHIVFYERAGSERESAERKVAEAFAVDIETLQQWKIRLPHLLGSRAVGEKLERAGAAGATARRLGLPLCQAEVRKRDQQLRSDAARHSESRRQFAQRYVR